MDKALSRHSRAGTLRKVARGLYDVPRTHPLVGQLSTSSDAVAAALKGRDAIRLQPSADFETGWFSQHGSLGMAHALFGGQLTPLLIELNTRWRLEDRRQPSSTIIMVSMVDLNRREETP